MPIDPRRLAATAAGLVLAAALAGCGSAPGTDPEAALTVGPNGGPAMPLGEQGYAEVVVEPAPGAGKRSNKVVLAVYFLGTDRNSALSPPPSDVSIALETREGGPQPVPLAPKPEPSKPGGAARFASEPGSFDADALVGELTATVGGETYTRPFTVR